MDPSSVASSSSPPVLVQASPTAEQMVQWMHMMQAQINGVQSKTAAPRRERPKPPGMEKFTGLMGGSGFAIDNWLREVDKQFTFYAVEFATDDSKIRFAVLWLSGDAQTWWENEDKSAITTWVVFVEKMRDRYRPQMPEEIARQRMRNLKQRGRVETYCNEFLKIAALLKSRDEADKIFDFKEGLDRPLASKVAEGKPKTLQEAMEMAVQAEPYIGARGASSSGFQFRPPSSFRGASSGSSSSGVAMDINAVGVEENKEDAEARYTDTGADHTIAALMTQVEQLQQRLNSIQQAPSDRGYQRVGAPKSGRVSGRTGADISRMMKEGRCFICGNKGHMKNECPKPKNS